MSVLRKHVATNMIVKKFTEQFKFVAVFSAIFILIAVILDAFFGIPYLNNLVLHSPWVSIVLVLCLWIIAFFATNANQDDEDA